MKLRGESMQAAADAKPSGMVSVIGLDSDKVAELCAVGGWVAGWAAHRGTRAMLDLPVSKQAWRRAAGCQPTALRSVRMPAVPMSSWRHPSEPLQAATAEVGADKAVKIANYLCPGNYAVSGSKEGCDAVEKMGKSFKARWVQGVGVGGWVGGEGGVLVHGVQWCGFPSWTRA